MATNDPTVRRVRIVLGRALRRAVPAALGLLVLAAPRAAVQAQGAASPSYRLVDTWRDRPWTLAPDRVGAPRDVTSTADGRTILLDDLPPQTLRVLGAVPGDARVIALPDDLHAVHIDAAGDASVAVLTQHGLRGADVAWFDLDGGLVQRTQLPASRFLASYADIAAGRDGRLYVAANDRTDIEDPDATARIYVLKPDGTIEHELDIHRWFPVDHSVPGHVHPRIGSLDVGPDGRLFAALTMVPCT